MYKKILVPLDGSELAECVLPHVEAIAKGCLAESITFVRVVEPVYLPISADPDQEYTFSAKDWQRMEAGSKAAAEEYLKRLTSKIKYNGVKIEWEVIVGKAAESIADYASSSGADLIAIATHGRSGVGRWVWGSVADKLLRSSLIPILMVRPPGSGFSGKKN
jgi:nucleotide-binding universal stress UspA family protein